MMKILQITLVVVVVLAVLAFIVERMIAQSTYRAREASSALLKEKLAQSAGERDVSPADPVGPSEMPESASASTRPDKDALRARWIALYEEVSPKLYIECGRNLPRELREAVSMTLMGGDPPELTDAQRAEVTAYRECIRPARTQLVDLVAQTGNPLNLATAEDLSEAAQTYEAARRYAYWILRISFNLESFEGDHVSALDTYIAATRVLSQYDPLLEPVSAWSWCRSVQNSAQFDDGHWDRLLDALALRRQQEVFVERVKFEAAQTAHAFENWKSLYREPSFLREDPVSYFRTWAYPRLTPALFNHDVDRFNRATSILLDLVERPYYEVRPELIAFYDEFDVEPDYSDLKFTRTNPGWRFVVQLSRGSIYANARIQVSIDVMRFAILLDRHHRVHGSYPASLAIFADHFGGALPVNPLRGDNYVYEVTGDSFKLGFTQEEAPALVDMGMDPIRVTYWHDPMGLENAPE